MNYRFIELVKKQSLAISPEVVELRYQSGGEVEMYDPYSGEKIGPAELTITNNTNISKTYSIKETYQDFEVSKFLTS